MRWIEVETSSPLTGTALIPGSKNSSQALIAAACMADGVRLHGIPKLRDISVISEMLSDIGIQVTFDSSGSVFVDTKHHTHAQFDVAKSGAYRAAYYFVGALLGRAGRVSVGYPGGDDFGQRPIDQHFKGLRALGAEVTLNEDHYVVEAKRLVGADFYFDVVTMGGTINVMLAAVHAHGETVLRNAARDPEVVDVANLLVKMGARIRGAGTSIIRIEGVSSLSGCHHTVIPDRLIAGTFLLAAAATHGQVTVQDVIPEHLSASLSKLNEMGATVWTGDQSVTVNAERGLRPLRVRTSAYPGFATDLQQPMTAALLSAPGKSIIMDTVYENRFNHAIQLQRMGADIVKKQSGIVVSGSNPLHGAWVHATDVRAGAALLIAGLNAQGTTRITGVEHIERGYEDAAAVFRALGAKVKWAEGEEGGNLGDFACL